MPKKSYGFFSIFFAFILLGFIPLVLQADEQITNKHLAIIHTIKGDIEAKYNELVQKKIKSVNFRLSDPHKRVNDAYKKKYGSTNIDILSFMSIVNEDNVKPLFNKDPRIAGFNPFNMLIYKKLNEDETKVGHLTPEAILDMIGISDKELRKEYIKSFEPLDALLKEELGGEISYLDYKKMAKKKMMNFEIEFERAEDLEDSIDDFQSKFEEKFEEEGYIIAGYVNFKETHGKDTIPEYDAFWTYSLCQFKFSYNIFDNEGGRPEGGLFAPCTMYMYIRKGSNKIVIGMPTLENWGATLGIDDKEREDFIKELDAQIPTIMKGLGAIETKNVNPLLLEKKVVKKQKVKKEPKNDTQKSIVSKEKKIQKSTLKEVPIINDVNVGKNIDGKISTYLRANFMKVKTAQERLKKAGFKILSIKAVDKKEKLISIVFTTDALQKYADKEKRGFMGSLRLLVDESNNQISISNPLYFVRAFMQDDFDKKLSNELLSKIKSSFGGLRNSKENLEYEALSEYHFMIGMPYYEDMIEVAKADSTQKLLEKIEEKNLVFTQVLSKNRILVGIQLGNRTGKFIKKLGGNNALLLPYPILLEDGVAKILDPKYYISISYPLLEMSEFMKIATIPGAIQNDCENLFK